VLLRKKWYAPEGTGGMEEDPVTLVKAVESLAYADGSATWTTMTGNSSIVDPGAPRGRYQPKDSQPEVSDPGRSDEMAAA
jgi:hypothetical protein